MHVNPVMASATANEFASLTKESSNLKKFKKWSKNSNVLEISKYFILSSNRNQWILLWLFRKPYSYRRQWMHLPVSMFYGELFLTKFFRPGYIYDETATLRNVCMDVCETNYCPNGQVCVHTDDGAVCIDDRSKFLKKSLWKPCKLWKIQYSWDLIPE